MEMTTYQRGKFPARKCTSPKRDGTPCTNHAVKGALVCAAHGGRLPTVRAAADRTVEQTFEQGLRDLVPKALKKLGELAEDAEDDRTQLAASKDILDRAGFGATQKVDMNVTSGGVDVDAEIEKRMQQMAEGS